MERLAITPVATQGQEAVNGAETEFANGATLVGAQLIAPTDFYVHQAHCVMGKPTVIQAMEMYR